MAFNGDLQNAKLVLLGEMGAGKSSLAQRFVKGEFNPSIDSTIGAAFLTKVMPEHGIKWEIWDTAGQERYHSLAPMYYRSAVAAIVVFDLSNPDSFERAKKWVTELRAHGHPGTKIALAANKCDLDGDNMVDVTEAQRYADQALLDVFLPTSARDGTNVTDLFSKLADKVPRSRPVPTAPQNAIDIVDGNSNPRKTGCC